jgi:hypothetical protein
MLRRRVLDRAITYVGLDVHKDTIAVALAEAGVRGDIREYGKVAKFRRASRERAFAVWSEISKTGATA